MSDLEEMARKLADYTRCLDPAQAICDRRVVDEAVTALRALATLQSTERNNEHG